MIKIFQFRTGTFKNKRRILAVSALLALLFVQLSWWLVFFESNRKEYDLLQNQIDQISLRDSQKLPDSRLPPDIIRQSGKLVIRPEVLDKRRREHRRKIMMLISETIFVLSVITYGSYRIIRSMQAQIRLGEERDIFLNSVSHELKTPIASILLNAQTMIKRDMPRQKRTELLEESIAEARRLEDQVGNLLLSRELGRKKFVGGPLQTVDAASAVRSFLDRNQILIRREDVRIDVQMPEKVILALDKELFSKILGNLLQNSISYSTGKPFIKIRLSVESKFYRKSAVLEFADNGSGIPKEELENIFKPFYRLSNDRGVVRGTGLGLHIVRQILINAGGTIGAESEGPGRGTVFTLRLPLAA